MLFMADVQCDLLVTANTPQSDVDVMVVPGRLSLIVQES